MMRFIIYHMIFFTCLLTDITIAQTAFYNPVMIDEKEESLPVESLYKDHLGYIWTGTKGGLYKFSGQSFINYLPDSLRSRLSITAIAEDHAKRIWFGANSGFIGYLENGQALVYTPEEGLPKKAITKILFDKKGRLWFSTADEGVYVLDHKKLYNINTDDGLTDNYVYTLALAPGGQVLAGTDRGISILSFDQQQKKVTAVSSRHGLPDNIVRVITPSGRPGIFLIGMEDQGICLLNLDKMVFQPIVFPAAWNYGRVNDILCSQDELWVATEDSGIISMDVKNETALIRKNLLPVFPKVKVISRDDEFNIWFNQPGKLIRTNGSRIGFLQQVENNPIGSVHALFVEDANTLWTTDGRAVHLLQSTSNRWKTASRFTFPGIQYQDITSLYMDSYGILWIGTMGAGIIRLDPVSRQWKMLAGNPVIEKGHILSVTGKDNEIWISGLNGLSNYHLTEKQTLYETIPFTNYHKQSGIGSDYIYQVFIDRRNRAWFATDGAGVACKDGDKIISYKDKAGLKSHVVYGLTEDSEGHLWLNTLEQGIVKFDGSQFKPLHTSGNGQGNSINAVIAGDSGELVIMQKKGIDLVQTATGRTLHWGKNNGITQQQINLNVIGRDPLGKTWIGTDDGLISLNPIPSGMQWEPKSLITQCRVFGEVIDTIGLPRLSYTENNITLYYDGLYYSDPDQVQFQYKLEGYHKDWITSNDRQVNFPKLSPGNYRFRLRSSLNGDFGNASETSFSFVVLLPFWKEWWFIFLASASTVLILISLMRQRLNQLQKWEHLKQDKMNAELQTLRAQVNPHFLFNSFNTLLGVIEEDPEQAIKYTEKLSAFYRSMLTYRDTDLIAVREEMKLLQTYIFLQQKRFGSGLRYQADIPANLPENYLIPPMTLQLLAENAIKHNTVSGDTPLTLRVFLDGENLVVTNSVNLKRTPEKGEGLGLKNIVHRYALFSEKQVDIEENETLFMVKLPLIKNNHHAHIDRRG